MKFYVPYILQTNPLLIRIETKAGHGGGKPTTKVVSMSECFIVLILTALLGFKPDLIFVFLPRFKKKLTYSVS
jgi:hypothetical protein